MADGKADGWNFGALLSQGIFNDIGNELTSEKLVLPFIYTALGGPILFAGLIYPIVRVAKLAAQIAVAPLIQAASRNKWYSVAALLTIAAVLAVICLVVRQVPVAWVVGLFILVALVLGVSDGLNGLAFTDMLGRILPEQRRSALLFTQSGVAGMIAVLVTFGSQIFVASKSALDAHIELMWVGVIMIVLAAAANSAVREPARHEKQSASADDAKTRKSHLAELPESFRVALALPWFRRFLVARTLFLSIELAMPFYAIHAALVHSDKKDGLSTFIIASCVGLVLGWIVWPRVAKRSIRVVLTSSAVFAGLGGLLALALTRWPQFQSPHPYSVVIALVAFSAQGISNGRTVFLVGSTDDTNRSYCVAASNVLTGVLGIAMAAALGFAAHIHDIRWPMWIIVLLNVTAGFYAFKLDAAKHPPDHMHHHVVQAVAAAQSGRGR